MQRRLHIGAALAAALTVHAALADCPQVVTVDTLPPLPIAISNNAVASVDHGDGTYTLYSFMGITNPSSNASITPASYRFDGPDGAWSPIADAPLLNGRAKIGSNAITVAGEVYLVGGYTVSFAGETTEPRLFRYDPDDDLYVQLADVPTEVDDTVVGVYQGRYVYLVSGWHGPLSRNVPDVQFYDTIDGTWDASTPIPAPLPGLFGHAGGIVGDRVIYTDGARSTGNFGISDRAFVGQIDPDGTGDLTTIEWSEIAAHPGAPTYRAASSLAPTADDRWLLVGGSDNTYNISGNGYNGIPSNALSQVVAVSPVDATWAELSIVGDHVATMDHRGLVQTPDGWVTIGGMTVPGTTTDRVQRYRLEPISPPGDVDCDGTVGFLDLVAVLGNWGPCVDCAADLDDDGLIGFLDLVMVLGGWTSS